MCEINGFSILNEETNYRISFVSRNRQGASSADVLFQSKRYPYPCKVGVSLFHLGQVFSRARRS
jgi:hypothetical protein